MKNILKVLGSLVIAFLLVVSVLPAFLSKTYELSRSVEIQAPVEKTFAYLADFNNFKNWNPFLEAEPQAHVEVQGSGVGSTYYWKGEKTGEGRMTLAQLAPNQSVGIQMNFIAPMAGEAQVAWQVNPGSQSGTSVVTWKYFQEMPYFNRIFGLFADKMMMPTFDHGLQKLKAELERK